MATSSIFENIKITDPEVAEAFVRAIEMSIQAQNEDDKPSIDVKMSTREDLMRRYNKQSDEKCMNQ